MAGVGRHEDRKQVREHLMLRFQRLDQFDNESKRYAFGEEPDPPNASVEKSEEGIRIWDHGRPRDVKLEELDLIAWDEAKERYDLLDRNIAIGLPRFSELLAQMARASGPEKLSLQRRVEIVRRGLCSDFRELVDLDQRVLKLYLPDHYQLAGTCDLPFAIGSI
jgi:hypothetical protein